VTPLVRADVVAGVLDGWDRPSASLYIALAEALATAIAGRRIGSHLPSERALAAALHVSRGTVAKAYEVLRERGLLERVRGSGTIAAAIRTHTVCEDPLACLRAFFAEPAAP
jgi:DNA-binding GntR family transcriptional regulator